jgi:hypothetical protein
MFVLSGAKSSQKEGTLGMKRMLLGAVGVLALQVLLVGGYEAVSKQDPIVLNPDRGGLVENGVVMAAFCGEGGSGKEMLDELPANGRWDSWTRGQTVRGDCNIWYHHRDGYSPCSHPEYTFDRPCGDAIFRSWPKAHGD